LPSPSPPPADVPDGLPAPDTAAREHSARLGTLIRSEIQAAGGHIPFDRFMELVLYAPGLGYYVAGSRKFGAEGDFVTAPEVSPLFGQCLAAQCEQVLTELGGGDILEFGAGSGRLAADLLAELERRGRLPGRYLILELSPELRRRQQQLLARERPGLSERVHWLERMPDNLRGLVLANEVLDAMPVQRFRIGAAGPEEESVGWEGEGPAARFGSPVSPGLLQAIQELQAQGLAQEPGYHAEINLRLGPWLRALAASLEAGAALLIDYGYPRRELFHPQRSMGTLMCHYRHRAHADPYRLLGLQDITAHVDFTAVAAAGSAAGLVLAGYTTQAHFLFGCGLEKLLARSDPADVANHLTQVQGVRRLTLPHEMGEAFKVLALGRGLDQPLIGFSFQDLRGRL
jgi:SAM-dependent MidA family methyltransferase